MATGLLIQSGSAALPLEYSIICSPEGTAWNMDRFIPSSRQPQHWSRNYHGSYDRRRSVGHRRESPETQEKDTSCYRQGITLRAEDLLVESENKLGTGSRISPAIHLTPRPGDGRREVLGGSATELAQCSRPRAPLRRSSEGATAYPQRRRKSSSSSSNAADDPTSSDPSSSRSTASSTTSSSSSESGCNADSETCNYCRLTESSEGRETSTEDDRSSSSSPPKLNGDSRRLTTVPCKETYPSSRPIRRTSPGEYLRHKRKQMERLRTEQLRELPVQRRGYNTFQRCDSDPRLSRKAKETSPTRTSTYASPTRNRVRRTNRRKGTSEEEVPVTEVILPVPSIESKQQGARVEKPRRSALAKNIAERQSRSKDRRSSVVWSQDDSTPFIEHRASFRCAVCDCDIPFTNCVLCNAEAKASFVSETGVTEILLNEGDLVSLDSEDLVIDGEKVTIVAEVKEQPAQFVQAEGKELEEFYDHPTPAEPPSIPQVQQQSTDKKRNQWTSKTSTTHKSLNQEDYKEGRRSSLRKYNSEPVPDTEDFHFSREQSEAGTPKSQSSDNIEAKAESSAPSSSKSEKKAGYHIAKDSPSKQASQSDPQNPCHFCGKTTEEEEKTKSQTNISEASDKSQKKSPVFLKPEFNFEPEIIHKANPLVDEADVDIIPSAVGAFRRLSEEEFISTLNIHEAAKKGDLHVVKLLTKKDPKQMETVDERGWTPIHVAAAHGHTEVVKYLAIEGAHLAALDPSSYTAIHLASMNGHNAVLEVLLPMGVDIDSVTAEGFTALHLAVMNCHLDCIQTLLQWGASLDKRDALGRGIQDMIEEYNLQDVATVLKRFHKQLHNFKHLLDMMNSTQRHF